MITGTVDLKGSRKLKRVFNIYIMILAIFIEGIAYGGSQENSALMEAAREGHKEVVVLLLAKGADVNLKEKLCGETALMFTAEEGYKEIAEILLAKGAKINEKDKFGWTALECAARGGGGSGNNKISNRKVAKRGNKDVVEALLAKGAELSVDSDGNTVLMIAALWNNKEVVELLLTKVADIKAKNNKDETVLTIAKNKGHQEIVRLLKKAGAKE